MRGNQFAVVAVAAALMLTACGSTEKAPETVTVQPPTVTTGESPGTAAPPSPAVTTTASSVPPIAATPAGPWSMPNLVGQSLQAAQDAVQALTGNPLFVSTSSDLTGKDRAQMVDRNWQVCSSNPPPGTPITADSSVDFGVVKDDESCP